jgi:hypothetical protein
MTQSKTKNADKRGGDMTAQPLPVPAANIGKREKRIFPSRKRRRAEKIAPSCPL